MTKAFDPAVLKHKNKQIYHFHYIARTGAIGKTKTKFKV